jgi:hypothetical protein
MRDAEVSTLRRWWDRWRHPGEFTEQRAYRHWREGLQQHAPAGPFELGTVAPRRAAPAAPLAEPVAHGEGATKAGTGLIHGVRIDHG